MVQVRDGARLASETLSTRGSARTLAQQDLDGDRSIEPRVARLIDLAHAAGAEQRLNLVHTEQIARMQVAR